MRQRFPYTPAISLREQFKNIILTRVLYSREGQIEKLYHLSSVWLVVNGGSRGVLKASRDTDGAAAALV